MSIPPSSNTAHANLGPPLWISVFGLGTLRPAPGTWGSLPPVAIAALLYITGNGPHASPIIYYVTIGTLLITFSAACILQGPRAERFYGRKDPSNVVADETAGQCLSLLGLPLLTLWPMLSTLAFAFVAFRIFDILKPWPANGLQRLSAGWGILIDDLIAGAYAAAATLAFSWFIIPYIPFP